MANGKSNLFAYLQRYFRPAKSMEMQPILILDTSAIIDIEQSYQKRYGLRRAHIFLEELITASEGASCIVPKKVFGEVAMHHAHSVINGRPEISQPTYERLRASPPFSPKLVEEEYGQRGLFTPFPIAARPEEELRYFLRLLCASELCGKKAERDPISRADWDVIDTALSIGCASVEQFRANMGRTVEHFYQHCYKVAVLTADEHILWTLTRSFAEPEGVEMANFLSVVDTRLYAHLPQRGSQ